MSEHRFMALCSPGAWFLHLGADLGMTNVSATSLVSQKKLRENAPLSSADRELAKGCVPSKLLNAQLY